MNISNKNVLKIIIIILMICLIFALCKISLNIKSSFKDSSTDKNNKIYGIVLFYTIYNGKPYLLLSHKRHGDVWTHLGGKWEKKDGDLLDTIYRETIEETLGAVLSLSELKTILASKKMYTFKNIMPNNEFNVYFIKIDYSDEYSKNFKHVQQFLKDRDELITDCKLDIVYKEMKALKWFSVEELKEDSTIFHKKTLKLIEECVRQNLLK